MRSSSMGYPHEERIGPEIRPRVQDCCWARIGDSDRTPTESSNLQIAGDLGARWETGFLTTGSYYRQLTSHTGLINQPILLSELLQ